MNEAEANFIYLDGPEERTALIDAIKQVRRAVAALAEGVPEGHHYTPRYEGDSLATTLAHLATADAAGLWLLNASVNGFYIRIPAFVVEAVDQLLRWVFQRRLVDVSLAGIARKQAQIIEFIESLPMDRFTADVHHPGIKEPLTVERALQMYFLHHWQAHLRIMQQVEGVEEDTP